MLLVVAGLLALTGCVKFDTDLEVNADETVSGRMLIAVDKEVAERFGQSEDDIRERLDDWTVENAPEGVECKPYEDDKYAGTECLLDRVPFAEMTGQLRFAKEGDRFVVTGGVTRQELPRTPASVPDPEVTFTITMPGRIIEHDAGAEVDGRSATYTDPQRMSAIRLVAEPGGVLPVWGVVLIALLAFAAIAGLLILLGRRYDKRTGYGTGYGPGRHAPTPPG